MAEILKPIEKKEEDEMIPVDKWDGECWKTFFDQMCVPLAKKKGGDPWEHLANFISTLLALYAEKGE